MTVKTHAITCDLDSTLADTRHRAATMINQTDREATDWLAYAQACHDDTPTDVVALLKALYAQYTIVLVTSRPEGARSQTESWLDNHDVPFDALVMDDGFFETPEDYKVAAIEQVHYAYDVVLHIDDWWGVGEAVRDALGIPTVIVRVYAPGVLDPVF